MRLLVQIISKVFYEKNSLCRNWGGLFGRFHAQKYQLTANSELVAVCDLNVEACNAVSSELGVSAYYDYQELFGKVDAVSIAATTNKHYEIAKSLYSTGHTCAYRKNQLRKQ